MNILVLNYEYPPLGGGAGVITQNISERLALFGHKVTVVTTWYHSEKEIEKNGNLEIIRLRSKRRYKHKSSVPEMLSWISESRNFLKNYCHQEKFDLCFANFAVPGGIVALWLKKKFGLKYFIISHGHDIPWMFPKQMFFFHAMNYYRIKKICSASEANFVQTSEMKKNIDSFLGTSYQAKNIKIPNGTDGRIFKPSYKRRNEQFKIVFGGRLVDQKDPFTFLNAVRLFAGANKNFTVRIIGDGVLRPSMEKFVTANGLSEIVKFTGWVSRKEMVEEYQSAHVSVVTSVFEGMSVAVLELLACGCYLITTPLAGIDEVISPGENADVVNFHSPAEVAKRLENYFDTKYKSGYIVSEAVLKKLDEKYNWDNIVREYEKYFIKCLG